MGPRPQSRKFPRKQNVSRFKYQLMYLRRHSMHSISPDSSANATLHAFQDVPFIYHRVWKNAGTLAHNTSCVGDCTGPSNPTCAVVEKNLDNTRTCPTLCCDVWVHGATCVKTNTGEFESFEVKHLLEATPSNPVLRDNHGFDHVLSYRRSTCVSLQINAFTWPLNRRFTL